MVYFVGHCIHLNGIWVPLTHVPVDVVSLGQDVSARRLHLKDISLQLLWQNSREMRPLAGTIIKTRYIRQLQQQFRSYLVERRRKTLPGYILSREIGVRHHSSLGTSAKYPLTLP